MPSSITMAGSSLRTALLGQPFHLMYEESSKKAGATNLNPLLRQALNGQAKRYPLLLNATCDLVFCLDSKQIWIESKLMQPHNGGNRDDWHFHLPNVNFQKYLGLLESPSQDSAVRDVRDRLPTLDGLACADYIGFLMVIFDSPKHSIDGHLDKFEIIGGITDWNKEYIVSPYPDPRPRAQVENARVSVIYWERATRE